MNDNINDNLNPNDTMNLNDTTDNIHNNLNKPSSCKLICMIIIALIYLIPPLAHEGFITTGAVSITLLHIPVILTTIIFGLPEGILTGLLFGLSSMGIAYIYSTGEIDMLFRDPLLSITPRILMPVVTWLIYIFVKKITDDNSLSAKLICNCFTALCGSAINTFFVLIALIKRYPEAIGATDTISSNNLIINNMLGTNIYIEAGLATVLTCIVTVLYHLYETKHQSVRPAKPIRKSFQKWLFLFIVISFFVMFYFLLAVLTTISIHNNEIYLTEKTNDISMILSELDGTPSDDMLMFGKSGRIFIVKNDEIIHAGDHSYIVRNLSDVMNGNTDILLDSYAFAYMGNMSIAYYCKQDEGQLIFTYMPLDEIYYSRNHRLTTLLCVLLILFIIEFHIISRIVKSSVVKKLQLVNNSLSKIREGDLNEIVDVRNNSEFEELSSGINSTVAALKDTMEEIEAKNRDEKEFARRIQLSALPNSNYFQSDKGLYEIWGMMDTAEEVGGDFFDYYLLDSNRLGFIIADVSGKGVPAALFMMTAKTLIKDMILSGMSPAEAFEHANAALNENNEAGMFVTAWLCIADSSTGTLTFANAGHNPPILSRADGTQIFLDHKHFSRSLMLGMMPGITYTNNELDIASGDLLFLYTDGVTEARNATGEQYGEERLKDILEATHELNVKELLAAIRKNLDEFSGTAEQFDDITMVAYRLL